MEKTKAFSPSKMKNSSQHMINSSYLRWMMMCNRTKGMKLYCAQWIEGWNVSFVVNPVFGDKQRCEEDLHCGRDCESGFSRHSEAHGLCGVLQRCLVGSYWDCSLSFFPQSIFCVLLDQMYQTEKVQSNDKGNIFFYYRLRYTLQLLQGVINRLVRNKWIIVDMSLQ